MAQKVIKIGSSLGVTIPKQLLSKLGVSQSDEIELNYNTRREAIEITAIKPKTESGGSVFGEIKEIIDTHQGEFAKLDD